LSDEEFVQLKKDTYWADNITNKEWPVVLREEGVSPSAKSRLKKKAAGWMIALGRISLLNPELFEAAWQQAQDTYQKQIEDKHPLAIGRTAWVVGDPEAPTFGPATAAECDAFIAGQRSIVDRLQGS
jgi:hypothetical protein